MIKIKNAKSYCCEDISLIENYALAVADTTQTWDCHHRGEILPCGRFKAKHLKKFNLYYNRPASELIFLPHDDHASLHRQGVPLSEATKQKMSEAHKGVPRSEATKKAIGKANSKKILQYTKSGEFVREWASMTAIWQELGIRQSSICACCKGKYKSAGGDVWRYAT